MNRSGDHPLLVVKSSFKTAMIGVVVGVIGIVLIVACVDMISEGKSVVTSLLAGAGGLLLLLWCFFEIKHIRDEEYYYADRIERLVGGNLKAQLNLADGFKVSYAIAEGTGDALLIVASDNNPSFSVQSAKPSSTGDSFNPPLPQVEKLRDHLVDIVETQILEAVNQGQQFTIDKRCTFNPDGISIDGNQVAWENIGARVNNNDGEITITNNGQRVAHRYMMDDNILPALAVIQSASQ